MKSLFHFLLAGAALFAAATAQAEFIYIDVSYKVIRNPANGNLPPGFDLTVLNDTVERMNELLASYGRGYRLRTGGGVAAVGAMGDSTGPSQWYAVNFLADGSEGMKSQMESEARLNPPAYRWSDSMINIYVNMANGGGCAFRPGNGSIVVIGVNSFANPTLTLHELGHYFGLCHTHGCCNDCEHCGNAPGNDTIADTLTDSACWSTADDIARFNFGGRAYANLTPAERAQVDSVYRNIMSYHDQPNQSVLTEGQLDHWAEHAAIDRRSVTSGRTLFVSLTGGCLSPDGDLNCHFVGPTRVGGPFSSVASAVNAANAGDLVLLRAGAYNQTLTINKAITLRATRAGAVSVGASVVR